ncbi:hypothetical protein [Bradyrhizobium sp. 188]|uniref:hypothetical protein n=1 Tax=Bradyrhizobium sp. 188 TaxID=2782656 RepID=UPI001FF8728B|nr:hypothetical protein [Bradyrhizobium sp. 188]MCK1500471.1 hypothetical protein [Bradyrhizobium sp. 188]
MSKVVETIFIENAADPAADDVVARGVTLPGALVLALEHGAKGRATIVHGDIGPLQNFGGHLGAGRAMQVLEQVPLNHPHEFWSGLVVTNGDHARRHHERSAS